MSYAQPDGRIVVRGYRTVFAFERRLYRLDQWRIPLRGGLPLRALGYVPAVYLALALASRVPGLGALLELLPDPVHWGLLPLGLVAALLGLELDGRGAHRALWALVRWRLGARWVAGTHPCPPPHGLVPLVGRLVVRHDYRAASYRPARITGPARVLLRAPARLSPSGPRRLVLDPEPGRPRQRGQVVEIPSGGVLELR
jgi:hypothetical protein